MEAESSRFSVSNVYTTDKIRTDKTYRSDNRVPGFGYIKKNVINGASMKLSDSMLKGVKAYTNTALDFWSSTNTTGVWAATGEGRKYAALFLAGLGAWVLNTLTAFVGEQAADIANELVALSCIYLPQIMETEEPNLVEEAIVPAEKASPSYAKNVLLGGLLGAVLCCGVLVVRYLMNDTFVTPDDIQKYFGVQPLATIPEGSMGDFNRDEKKNARRKEAK